MRIIWGSGSANQHRNEVKIEMKQTCPYHVDPSEYTDELMEEKTTKLTKINYLPVH